MSTNHNEGTSINFVGLLTIVFITLKLTDFIDWSWWWVLSPLWISWSIVILFVVFLLVAWCIKELYVKKLIKRKRM